MLTVTGNAAAAINALTSKPNLPDDSGLRLSPAQGDTKNIELTVTPAPETSDDVVEEQGARVFLEPNVSTALDDLMLDAEADASGGMHFTLVPKLM